MKHQSPWLAAAEAQPYAPLTDDRSVDLAVIGGGITGLTTALLALRDGARVAVLEGDRIASGTTGGTTGKVTSQHSEIYRELINRHGESKAGKYAHANEAGLALVARLVDELGIDCDFGRAPAFAYTTDAEAAQRLQAEAESAAGLGLPASFVTQIDLPFDVAGAVRFENQAYFDAARYCQGLAAEIVRLGGELYEHSRVVEVGWMHNPVAVRTETATVQADNVVVATLLPIVDIGGFFAKSRPKRSYAIAVRLTGAAPQGMTISVDSPTRSTRPWPAGGPNGFIVAGDTHETGHEEDTEKHYAALEQWAREMFDVESVDYRWSAQDYSTLDDLPYVGRSPRTTNCYVATGFHKWGLSNGSAAAVMLNDVIAGRDNQWLEAFDSTRIHDASAAAKFVKDNVHVGQRLVGDRIARLRADDIADLEPGNGRIVRADGGAVAAYREPSGTVRAVDATCTHMGCTVQWNAGEKSWDCPCHGSRFDTDGAVLDGPAVTPLEAVDVAED